MHAIERTIDELRDAVEHGAVAVPSVSRWTVGMHVHHCCLSMIGISRTLQKSAPPKPRAKPSLQRFVALRLGYIPRGRAQSPAVVIPDALVAPDQLHRLLDDSVVRIRDASALDPDRWFVHPLLGHMDRDGALRFVLVHNRHHLRIVSDIIRRSR
ncbi:MAG TPA: DinB family protein [Candidatus Krumholzibacteria bacterium]